MQQSDYHQLTPDTVIDAVESIGVLSDSRILATFPLYRRYFSIIPA